MKLTAIVAGALAAALVCAHPGGDIQAELAQHRAMLSRMARTDLSHCAEKIKARGLEARAIARRTELVTELLMKSGELNSRDLDSVLRKSHHSDKDYDLETPYEVIFGSNSSCVLSPEVTEGPFYVAGEYVRKDIREHLPGIGLTVDVQVHDIETCDPVPNVFVEIYHSNIRGVYSGITKGDRTTWLRGFQKTDADGVVNFKTVFPGPYYPRTTHIHVIVHPHAQERSNGTILDDTASHIGQVYFDQDLIYKVENTTLYKVNKQPLVLNKDDGPFQQGAATSDPVMQYVELGDRIEDGLLAWISFGINTTLANEIKVAATMTKEGAIANDQKGFVQHEAQHSHDPISWKTIA
ncbi:Intradiol ring-cleavage dioxygenase [Rhypophila decipiens]